MIKKGDLVKGKNSAKKYSYANNFMEIGSVDEVFPEDGSMLVTVVKHSVDQATGGEYYEGQSEEVDMEDFELITSLSSSTGSVSTSVSSAIPSQELSKPTGYALAIALDIL
jgi:hypothetical protein